MSSNAISTEANVKIQVLMEARSQVPRPLSDSAPAGACYGREAGSRPSLFSGEGRNSQPA